METKKMEDDLRYRHATWFVADNMRQTLTFLALSISVVACRISLAYKREIAAKRVLIIGENYFLL